MRPVMPIFELVHKMMFVDMCVKFRDNRLRNGGDAVSGGQKTIYLRGYI